MAGGAEATEEGAVAMLGGGGRPSEVGQKDYLCTSMCVVLCLASWGVAVRLAAQQAGKEWPAAAAGRWACGESDRWREDAAAKGKRRGAGRSLRARRRPRQRCAMELLTWLGHIHRFSGGSAF